MPWSSKNRFGLLTAIGFGLLSFGLRMIVLNKSPYPNGWDGYYYVMQSHSWLTYGYLQSLDYSIIYPYFTFLSWLIGDYILAFKFGSALLGAALVSASCIIVRKHSNNWLLVLIIGCYLLFSPTLTFFIIQFPKNALGLIFFTFFLSSLISHSWKAILITFLFCIFSHRMIGGFCIILLVIYSLKYIKLKWIILGFIVLVIASLLPGIIHISDLMRFENQFSFIPQFAPFSFYRIMEKDISLWWTLDLIIFTSLVIVSIFYYARNKEYQSDDLMSRIGWPALLILCLLPFFVMDNGSMGYRFFLVAPVLWSTYFLMKTKWKSKLVYPAFILLLCFSFFSHSSYDSSKYDPPNKLYSIVVKRLSENYNSQSYSLVIVQKSLAEMIIYETSFDALNWNPPNGEDYDKTLRIVSNLEFFHFTKYLEQGEIDMLQKLSQQYYAMPENIWRSYLERVYNAKDVTILELLKRGGNPLYDRPEYLTKGKKL
ncbi:EpsG family protein [Ekhidna sp.]